MNREAPDWFGCGRKITQKSWDGFMAARREHYAKEDANVSFHAHLDRCEQCRTQPFGLCPIGTNLLIGLK